jgi:CheY-like chemotaxis protein
MNIVVVEDSKLQGKIISRQIKSVNPTWGVRVASCPEELLLLFEAESFNVDLILCDMMLGIGPTDGPRLVADLRNRYGAMMSEVVVVMMSKDCEERELISSRYAADAFWPKPLPTDAVILSHILQLVNKKAYFLLSLGRCINTDEATRGTTSPHPTRQSRSPSSGAESMVFTGPTARASTSSGRDGSEGSHDSVEVKRCRSDHSITVRPAPANQFSSSAGNMKKEASWSRFGQLVVEEPAGGVVEGLKICIVDDSQVQRRLLARTLSFYHGSWTVRHFPDSVECVRHLRANHFDVDVIFVDMNRHGGGSDNGHSVGEGVRGPDFVKMLREGLGLSRQVIIGLNRDYREVEKSFLIAGADTAWSKPLPNKEIGLNRIRQLILSRRGLALRGTS